MGPRAQDAAANSGNDLLLPGMLAVSLQDAPEFPHIGRPEAQRLVAPDSFLVIAKIEVGKDLVGPAVTAAGRLGAQRARSQAAQLEPDRSAGHPVPPVAYGGRPHAGRSGERRVGEEGGARG